MSVILIFDDGANGGAVIDQLSRTNPKHYKRVSKNLVHKRSR